MKYADLVAGIERFGSKSEDICPLTFGVARDKIKDRVIIAPWWEPSVFSHLGKKIQYLSASEHTAIKVWNITTDSGDITYIKTGIGAPVLTDAMLALGATSCKKAVFIGSVGALDPGLHIGDIVIPECSISGTGISRYLKGWALKDNDTFGEKNYPDKEMFHGLITTSRKFCEQSGIHSHHGRTFSSDTIFAQFAYLDEIIGLGCNTIEMETAPAFKAAELAGISLGALLSVSDNIILKKSLFSGRTQNDMNHRKEIRRMIFPEILLEVLK
jgi:purine-nucleoside phosphorylase